MKFGSLILIGAAFVLFWDKLGTAGAAGSSAPAGPPTTEKPEFSGDKPASPKRPGQTLSAAAAPKSSSGFDLGGSGVSVNFDAAKVVGAAGGFLKSAFKSIFSSSKDSPIIDNPQALDSGGRPISVSPDYRADQSATTAYPDTSSDTDEGFDFNGSGGFGDTNGIGAFA